MTLEIAAIEGTVAVLHAIEMGVVTMTIMTRVAATGTSAIGSARTGMVRGTTGNATTVTVARAIIRLRPALGSLLPALDPVACRMVRRLVRMRSTS